MRWITAVTLLAQIHAFNTQFVQSLCGALDLKVGDMDISIVDGMDGAQDQARFTISIASGQTPQWASIGIAPNSMPNNMMDLSLAACSTSGTGNAYQTTMGTGAPTTIDNTETSFGTISEAAGKLTCVIFRDMFVTDPGSSTNSIVFGADFGLAWGYGPGEVGSTWAYHGTNRGRENINIVKCTVTNAPPTPAPAPPTPAPPTPAPVVAGFVAGACAAGNVNLARLSVSYVVGKDAGQDQVQFTVTLNSGSTPQYAALGFADDATPAGMNGLNIVACSTSVNPQGFAQTTGTGAPTTQDNTETTPGTSTETGGSLTCTFQRNIYDVDPMSSTKSLVFGTAFGLALAFGMGDVGSTWVNHGGANRGRQMVTIDKCETMAPDTIAPTPAPVTPAPPTPAPVVAGFVAGACAAGNLKMGQLSVSYVVGKDAGQDQVQFTLSLELGSTPQYAALGFTENSSPAGMNGLNIVACSTSVNPQGFAQTTGTGAPTTQDNTETTPGTSTEATGILTCTFQRNIYDVDPMSSTKSLVFGTAFGLAHAFGTGDVGSTWVNHGGANRGRQMVTIDKCETMAPDTIAPTPAPVTNAPPTPAPVTPAPPTPAPPTPAPVVAGFVAGACAAGNLKMGQLSVSYVVGKDAGQDQVQFTLSLELGSTPQYAALGFTENSSPAGMNGLNIVACSTSVNPQGFAQTTGTGAPTTQDNTETTPGTSTEATGILTCTFQRNIYDVDPMSSTKSLVFGTAFGLAHAFGTGDVGSTWVNHGGANRGRQMVTIDKCETMAPDTLAPTPAPVTTAPVTNAPPTPAPVTPAPPTPAPPTPAPVVAGFVAGACAAGNLKMGQLSVSYVVGKDAGQDQVQFTLSLELGSTPQYAALGFTDNASPAGMNGLNIVACSTSVNPQGFAQTTGTGAPTTQDNTETTPGTSTEATGILTCTFQRNIYDVDPMSSTKSLVFGTAFGLAHAFGTGDVGSTWVNHGGANRGRQMVTIDKCETMAPDTIAPTPAPVTTAPVTNAPPTPAPVTPAPPTGVPGVPPTNPPVTIAPTTAPVTTAPLTTAPVTTAPAPPTPAPPTPAPPTGVPGVPPTNPPATLAPPTNPPATNPPATMAPPTAAPPTPAPPTPAPPTGVPGVPPTNPPATLAPPTNPPATNPPATMAPPTAAPPTPAPPTPAPPTGVPGVPPTNPPATLAPPTNPPATNPPATMAPPTAAPPTPAPPTPAPPTGVPGVPPTNPPPTATPTLSPLTMPPPTLTTGTMLPATESPQRFQPGPCTPVSLTLGKMQVTYVVGKDEQSGQDQVRFSVSLNAGVSPQYAALGFANNAAADGMKGISVVACSTTERPRGYLPTTALGAPTTRDSTETTPGSATEVAGTLLCTFRRNIYDVDPASSTKSLVFGAPFGLVHAFGDGEVGSTWAYHGTTNRGREMHTIQKCDTLAPPTTAPAAPTITPRSLAPGTYSPDMTPAPPGMTVAPITAAPGVTLPPQTNAPPTPAPPTITPRSLAPGTYSPDTTQAPPGMTVAPITAAPGVTLPPQTNAPPTPAPPTITPRSLAPGTYSPDTTQAPPGMTVAPITAAPGVTLPPQTNAPPTPAPPTITPRSLAPGTYSPDMTQAPPGMTVAPITAAPGVTLPPQTNAPPTPAPPTITPRSLAPGTYSPDMTQAPPGMTVAPITAAPGVTLPPQTNAPPTPAPPTITPRSLAPGTYSPDMTQAPPGMTVAPITAAPGVTLPPQTNAPPTPAPPTITPRSLAPGTYSPDMTQAPPGMTVAPITAAPGVTLPPQTNAPPTPAPPTITPRSLAPGTYSPDMTQAPPGMTVAPITAAPGVTLPPQTNAPPTPAPPTITPRSLTPGTYSPDTTPAPPGMTVAPITAAPGVTLPPQTDAPPTPAPPTITPRSLTPGTYSPDSTEAPAGSSRAPVTGAPGVTLPPQTDAPPTPAPPTITPRSLTPGTYSPDSTEAPAGSSRAPITGSPGVTLPPQTDAPPTPAPPTITPRSLTPGTYSPDSTEAPAGSSRAPITGSPGVTLPPQTDAPLTPAPPTITPRSLTPGTYSPDSTEAPPGFSRAPITGSPGVTLPPQTNAPASVSPPSPRTLSPPTYSPDVTGAPQGSSLVPLSDSPSRTLPPLAETFVPRTLAPEEPTHAPGVTATPGQPLPPATHAPLQATYSPDSTEAPDGFTRTPITMGPGITRSPRTLAPYTQGTLAPGSTATPTDAPTNAPAGSGGGTTGFYPCAVDNVESPAQDVAFAATGIQITYQLGLVGVDQATAERDLNDAVLFTVTMDADLTDWTAMGIREASSTGTGMQGLQIYAATLGEQVKASTVMTSNGPPQLSPSQTQVTSTQTAKNNQIMFSFIRYVEDGDYNLLSRKQWTFAYAKGTGVPFTAGWTKHSTAGFSSTPVWLQRCDLSAAGAAGQTPQADDDDSGFPIWIIFVIIGVLLLCGSVGAAALAHRKKQQDAIKVDELAQYMSQINHDELYPEAQGGSPADSGGYGTHTEMKHY